VSSSRTNSGHRVASPDRGYTITRADLDRPFDDVIAITGHWTKYACVYNIPYRSLLPESIDNLLVAGRCISADHRATTPPRRFRLHGDRPGCRTAAALAMAGRTSVQAVDVPALQQKLREAGAILG